MHLEISSNTQFMLAKLQKEKKKEEKKKLFPDGAAEKQKLLFKQPQVQGIQTHILLQVRRRLGQRTKCFTFLSQRLCGV